MRLMLEQSSQSGKTMSAKGESEVRDEIEKTRQTIANRRTRCSGITSEQMATRAHWLYRAAELGDAKSAYAFGTGEFLYADLFDELDQIPFWRDHAEQALQQSLEGGESAAVRYLAVAYDPAASFDFGGPKFAPDPEQAYVYYSVLSMTNESSFSYEVANALERLGAELDPEQIAAATQLAADICANDIPGACDAPQMQ